VKAFLIALITVPLLTAAFLYGLFLIWGDRLPVPKTMEELRPSVRSIVFDRNGAVLGGFYIEDRVPIPLSEMPDHLIQAVITSEDRRFYEHWGINLTAVVRAALSNLRAGGVTQGASTITQQLARNLFLDQSRTLERKLKEMVLAVRLEREFSKDEILSLYLNRIYFGEGAYGVQAAARRYFGKDVADLTLAEAAMVAGLPANPSLFSPVRHPEAARARRNRVLGGMIAEGVVAPESYRDAVDDSLEVLPSGSGTGEAPYFLEYVRRLLVNRYGTESLYEDGLQIHTTLDIDLQRTAEASLEKQLRAIEAQEDYDETFELYQENGPAAPASKTPYLQGALIAIEPQTGQILAMVGGRSWQDSKWNRAAQARLQPGSAFKPFIYAFALQQGARTNDIIIDEPVRYQTNSRDTTEVWEPRNFKEEFEGPMTLRYALAKSINVPSVKLIDELGPQRIVDFSRRLGMRGHIPPYLSLALGTAEVTPLDVASAYGTFANQGIHVSPGALRRVEDRFGRIIAELRPVTTEILDERSNSLLVSILQSVFDWGTAVAAPYVHDFHSPAAGKTGTTDDYTDAWFIGFVPRCVCAVWVGFDEKRSIGTKMTGAKVALPIWVDFMKAFVAKYGEEEFYIPDGLVLVPTCMTTGRLAGPYCPTQQDLFIVGTEPTDTCILHAPGLIGPPLIESEPEEEDW
jgi:penicillin-binding protein 1A